MPIIFEKNKVKRYINVDGVSIYKMGSRHKDGGATYKMGTRQPTLTKEDITGESLVKNTYSTSLKPIQKNSKVDTTQSDDVVNKILNRTKRDIIEGSGFKMVVE